MPRFAQTHQSAMTHECSSRTRADASPRHALRHPERAAARQPSFAERTRAQHRHPESMTSQPGYSLSTARRIRRRVRRMSPPRGRRTNPKSARNADCPAARPSYPLPCSPRTPARALRTNPPRRRQTNPKSAPSANALRLDRAMLRSFFAPHPPPRTPNEPTAPWPNEPEPSTNARIRGGRCERTQLAAVLA